LPFAREARALAGLLIRPIATAAGSLSVAFMSADNNLSFGSPQKKKSNQLLTLS